MTAGSHVNATELRNLSRWLLRVADEMDRAEAEEPPQLAAGSALPAHAIELQHTLLPQLAETEYRHRRRRTELFDPKFFGEPAWDMLLDLFINRARGQRVGTTSLCIASGVPPTTALRWIGLLERQGLVQRYFSERDRRLHYVELTDEGARRVITHFRDRLRQLP